MLAPEISVKNRGMDWGRLDEAHLGDSYLFRAQDTLEITRADDSVAIFDEVGNDGLPIYREGINLSVQDKYLAPGRALVKHAVDQVSNLDALFVPGSDSILGKKKPVGDWEPLVEEDEAVIAVNSLSRRALRKEIRQRKKGIDLVAANEHIHIDPALAIRLEVANGRNPTAVRLAGISKKLILNPYAGRHFWRPALMIQNKDGEIDVPPSDALPTGLFIKRPES